MGHIGWPVYGEDIGSAIEDAEKIIANIKTNKFDNKDILALFNANNVLLKHLLEAKNED